MKRDSGCEAFRPDVPGPVVVCVVDDDASVRRSLSNLLRSAGIQALPFACGTSFLASPAAFEAGCALLDLKMSGLGGTDVQRELGRLNSRLPVICMSAHWDDSALAESLRQGAVEWLCKPVSEETLLKAVGHALRGDRSGQALAVPRVPPP